MIVKPFEYYTTTKTPEVNSLDYKKIYVYKSGKLIWEGTAREFHSGRISLPYGCVQEEVFDEAKYKEHYTKRQKELNVLAEEFKQDLFDYFGVKDNPKSQRLYTLIVKHSLEYGFESVYEMFSEFVELIKE